jgi:hypothetical protein
MHVTLVNILDSRPVTHSTDAFTSFEEYRHLLEWIMSKFGIVVNGRDRVRIFSRDGFGENIDPLRGQWIEKRSWNVFNRPPDVLVRVSHPNATGPTSEDDYLFELTNRFQ